MSRVLLVEPHKILQQAITLALFPEHEIEVRGSVDRTGLNSLEDYELIIVDGAALREIKALTSEVTMALQNSSIPTLWIEEEESAGVPKRDKLLVLKKPIERDTLHKNVASLLGSKRPAKAESKAKAARGNEQESFEFIELVDVVDDQTSQKREEQRSKRSK